MYIKKKRERALGRYKSDEQEVKRKSEQSDGMVGFYKHCRPIGFVGARMVCYRSLNTGT